MKPAMKRATEYNSFQEIVDELRAIAKVYRTFTEGFPIVTAARWKGEPLDVALNEMATAVVWLAREEK